MALKLGHIELFVADIKRAKAFYLEILGCELVADQGVNAWVTWASGAVEILLRTTKSASASPATYQETFSGLVLYTDDLDATAETLRGRGLVFRGTDGPGCLTFTDPDGHWFQLTNPEHA